MKRTVYFIVMLLLGAGCNEKVIEKPENLIPRDKMIDIYQSYKARLRQGES